MKEFAHKTYLILGYIYAFFWLNIYRLRDFLFKPKEDSILFVAHPDDDTLFFHTFIKKHKPYVVLLTTGWSLRRIPGFKKNMKNYGVKFRFYTLSARETKIHLLEKHIKECFKVGNFKKCATHGKNGEYGHEMHQRVSAAVLKHSPCKVLSTVDEEEILNFPLPQAVVEEKINIFKKYYKTELFVLDLYDKWVSCEKLR